MYWTSSVNRKCLTDMACKNENNRSKQQEEGTLCTLICLEIGGTYPLGGDSLLHT